MTAGRSAYNQAMQQTRLRCYLYPQVYPIKDFEQTIITASDYGNLSSVREYLKVLINFFKSNPYAAAKLFHGIATDAFRFNPSQENSGADNM